MTEKDIDTLDWLLEQVKQSRRACDSPQTEDFLQYVETILEEGIAKLTGVD